MKKVPRVAVLLASYNGVQWIESQIQTILNSRNVSCHIFLSDDGSSDETVAVAQAAGLNKLTLLPYDPRGSAGQNFLRLIQDANWEAYDFIALSDQDDLWFPDKLCQAIAAIEDHGLAAYSSDVLAFWPDGRQKYVRKSQPLRKWDHLFESAGPGNTFVFPVHEALFLREQLNAANPKTLQRIERHDWLIYAIFREKLKKWMIDAVAGMDYRQHDNNVVGTSMGARARLSRLNLFKSGWYRSQILLIAEVTGASNALLDYIREPTFHLLGPLLKNARETRRNFLEAYAVTLLLAFMAFRGKP